MAKRCFNRDKDPVLVNLKIDSRQIDRIQTGAREGGSVLLGTAFSWVSCALMESFLSVFFV